MAQKIYVDYNGLKYYDEKMKAWVEAKDAQVLADAIQAATDMGENYEAAGSVATAVNALKENEIKANADAIGVLNGTGEGSVSKAVADAKSELQTNIDEVGVRADAAQGDVDTLEAYVGTFTHATAKSVVEYVDAKTSGIATDASLSALTDRVTQAEKDIDAIEADYLKSADKTELSNAIDVEKARAEGIESGINTRLQAVEADYLKGADKEELVGNINTNAEAIAAVKEDVDAFFKDADLTAQAKDTLKELQEYIASDETATSEMLASIQQNGNDIDAVEGRMTTAEGKITTVEGKVSTLESEMTQAKTDISANASAVATKAEKSYVDDEIAKLVAVDEGYETRIAAVEAKFGEGEGNVESQIEAAKQAAIEAAGLAADEKDAAILASAKEFTTTEIGKIDLSGIANNATAIDELKGRMTTAEGDITNLEGRMTAVEEKATANESAIATANTEIAKKANQTAVEALSTRMDTHDGHYSALADRVTAAEGLVGEGFVALSNAQIDSLFTA